MSVTIERPTITMYGAEWCGDCRRTKRALDAAGVDYDYLDVAADNAAADEAVAISGRQSIPVVVFPDGTHMVEPSDPDLLAKLASLSLT